jgi:NAD(P)-dependent dehydrogenase (short-subunit alcohol dehydrogenase family)
MKTIFITGASAGLGKATAKLFQASGWRVIATMRNPEKETELQHLAHVTVLPLDVTNAAQIADTVQQALALTDIDVVFNNAGHGLIGALETYTDAQIAAHFDTNVLGVLRVTRAFIPYFKARCAGLFITTTSLTGLASYPLSSVYNAGKWALEGWSESMAYDLALFNIGIKTVAPGGIKSAFTSAMQVTQDAAYDGLLSRLNDLFADGTLMQFTEPEIIAQVVYEAATDGKDQLRYLAGPDAVQTVAQRLAEGSEAYRQRLTKLFNLKS